MLDDQAWFDLIEVVAATDFYRTQHQIIFDDERTGIDDAPLDAVCPSGCHPGPARKGGWHQLLGRTGGIDTRGEQCAGLRENRVSVRFSAADRSRKSIADSAFTPDGRDTDTPLELAEQSVFQIAENR